MRLIISSSQTNIYVYVFIYVLCLLWRVEPLLCNDREMGGYTRPVSGQRLSKHVPAATDTNANNRRAVFSMWSVPRCYKHGSRLVYSQFCTGVCEERTWGREAEESPLLEAIARKRPVKTMYTECPRIILLLCIFLVPRSRSWSGANVENFEY
jgi:hypothetical protein